MPVKNPVKETINMIKRAKTRQVYNGPRVVKLAVRK